MVLHVIPVDSEMVMGIHAVSEVLREEISGQLDKLLEMAKDADVACKVFVEEAYQPDKAIVELAHREKADILVMDRHSRAA